MRYILYGITLFFTILGLCFRFVNEAKTFSDAQTFCNDDNGATFFVPTNKEAHDTIRTEANVQFSSTQSYWIGIADNADEGKFVFVDGDFINKEIKFKQWALNQPNNYGKGTYYIFHLLFHSFLTPKLKGKRLKYSHIFFSFFGHFFHKSYM